MMMGTKPKRKLTPEAARLRYKIEKAQCMILAGFLIPGYYLIQIVMVKICLLHYILSVICFTNIAGNMYLSIFTDTKVGTYEGEGEYCEICKQKRPPMSWHCPTCNACMKRSDHHCYFLAHCVGRNNYRYFVCFLFHWVFGMTYCSVWYIMQISQINMWAYLESMMVLMPVIPMRIEDFYIVCLFIDLLLLCIGIGLFAFHARNVWRGTTSYQTLKRHPYPKRHWRTNVEYVLGTRWYWAILWPFASSPFPDYELANITE